MIHSSTAESFGDGTFPSTRPAGTPRSARRSAVGRVGLAIGVASALALVPAIALADVPEGMSLLLHSDFEDGVEPWGPRGAVALELTSELGLTSGDVYEGSSSLLVSGRTDEWNGVATDAMDLFQPGQTYQVEAWVKLPEGTDGASDLHFTVEEEVDGAADDWVWVGAAAEVDAHEWVQIGGEYTMRDGLSAASLYIEAAGIGDNHPDFLVDEIRVFNPAEDDNHNDDDNDDDNSDDNGDDEPAPDLGLNNDFEEGLGAWAPRGAGEGAPVVELSTETAHGGDQSALVRERGANWHGIAADVTDIFAYGEEYDVELWARVADGEDPAGIRISVEREVNGEATYDTVTTVEDVGQDWVRISGAYMMGNADSATLYVETAEGTTSFHVDDIAVTGAVPGEVDLSLLGLQDAVDWPLGVAIDSREMSGASAELTLHHYNQITAENHMKPDFIQPTEGNFTFDAADALIQFAVDNNLTVYGHTLVWHSQTPDWFFEDADGNLLTDSPAHQTLLLERMETHINTTVDHFRDTFGEYGTPGNPIVAYDVVNEAISEAEDDGLRRSHWYNVLGEEYLDHAFRIASEAFNGGNTTNPPVTLFLNDYNTELPAKRAAMIEVVQRMQSRGVPISGVGHQFHVSLEQPISQLRASLDAFGQLGLPQAVTELDVGITGAITGPRLVQQGYYYADLFDLFAEYPDLFSVTIWGPYDTRSWRAEGAPLPFDGDLQAKPAYWGIVDREQLPVLTQIINAHQADIALEPDALTAVEWDLLPEHELGADHAFSVRWSEEHLNVLVRVADDTGDGNDEDVVSVFVGSEQVHVPRAEGAEGAIVSETDEGYLALIQVDAGEMSPGDQVPFDVRLTHDGEHTSWNDFNHTQESGEGLGVLNLIEPVAFVQIPQAEAGPEIDGDIDPIWEQASEVLSTEVEVEGSGDGGATAQVRLLWHGEQLFILMEVEDDVLDEANSNAWEQDSVEIFLDPVNAKSGPYNPDDGQYRISFSNFTSIGGEPGLLDRLTSATSEIEGGYVVEAALDLGYAPEPGSLVGLEFQVNDAAEGTRDSVRTWTDPTGRSYQDTSRWGVGQLVGAADDGEEPGEGVDPGEGESPGDGADAPAAPQIQLSSNQVHPGDALEITGTGFATGTSVSGLIESDPIELGVQVASSEGQVAYAVQIPMDISLGEHTVTLTASDGAEAVATFQVIAEAGEAGAGASTGQIPATGVDGLMAVVALALAALALGTVLRARAMA